MLWFIANNRSGSPEGEPLFAERTVAVDGAADILCLPGC